MLHRQTGWILGLLGLIASIGFTKVASAGSVASNQEGGESLQPVSQPLDARGFFVGAWGGFAFANASHPELATEDLLGAIVSLHGGYSFSSRIALSLSFTNFEAPLVRSSKNERFSSSRSFLKPLAECTSCEDHVLGGYVVDANLLLSSLGPRIDISPFGETGLYLGASGGLAILSGLETRNGLAGTAHAGFRMRPIYQFSLAVEGGIQAETFSDASAVLGYGALQVRAHF